MGLLKKIGSLAIAAPMVCTLGAFYLGTKYQQMSYDIQEKTQTEYKIEELHAAVVGDYNGEGSKNCTDYNNMSERDKVKSTTKQFLTMNRTSQEKTINNILEESPEAMITVTEYATKKGIDYFGSTVGNAFKELGKYSKNDNQ